ncbi:MAG: AEC family transporter [Oscillospiraceae bacterium]|nr:AEC family transporter [Oscillospiraceae bacterium]
MDAFQFSFRAICPILLLILLGYVMRKIGSWDDKFYARLNSLCFHLFLPVQVFCNIYTIGDLASMNWPLLGFLVICNGCAVVLGFICARLFVPDRRRKGCMIQAAFRSNQAVLGIPLAESLGGAAAVAFASLASAFFVPAYNVIAVLVLTYYGAEQERPSVGKLLRRVIRNPLVISALLGVAVVLIRQFLPQENGELVFSIKNQLPSIYKLLTDCGKVAAPLMLFALGARLNFSSIRDMVVPLVLGVSLRIAIVPGVCVALAVLLRETLHITAIETPTILAICASPIAVSSAVMTQEIGGDEQLANQQVVWSSVLSMFTIFVFVFILRSIGML